MDLMRGVKERVYPVGRLDYHSEGCCCSPTTASSPTASPSAANHVIKTYVVKVKGQLTAEQEGTFREGVPLRGRQTGAGRDLKLIRKGENPWYEVNSSKAAKTRSA